jgi:hypothetical protein
MRGAPPGETIGWWTRPAGVGGSRSGASRPIWAAGAVPGGRPVLDREGSALLACPTPDRLLRFWSCSAEGGRR